MSSKINSFDLDAKEKQKLKDEEITLLRNKII